MSSLVQIYNLIFIVSAVLSFIMLIVSVFIFIKLDIPKAFGDITGTNAKRAIEQIREQNIAAGDRSFKMSPVYKIKSGLTDKIFPSIKIRVKNERNIENETAVLTDDTELLTNETDLLINETEILVNESTEILEAESEYKIQETTVLSENFAVNAFKFDLDVDIMLVNTNETI